MRPSDDAVLGVLDREEWTTTSEVVELLYPGTIGMPYPTHQRPYIWTRRALDSLERYGQVEKEKVKGPYNCTTGTRTAWICRWRLVRWSGSRS